MEHSRQHAPHQPLPRRRRLALHQRGRVAPSEVRDALRADGRQDDFVHPVAGLVSVAQRPGIPSGAHPLLGQHPDRQCTRFAIGGCQLGGDLIVDSRCNGPRLLPVLGPPGRALGPLSRQRVVQADVRLRRVLLRHEHSHAVRSDPDRASLGRHAAHAARRTITGASQAFLGAGKPCRRTYSLAVRRVTCGRRHPAISTDYDTSPLGLGIPVARTARERAARVRSAGPATPTPSAELGSGL